MPTTKKEDKEMTKWEDISMESRTVLNINDMVKEQKANRLSEKKRCDKKLLLCERTHIESQERKGTKYGNHEFRVSWVYFK